MGPAARTQPGWAEAGPRRLNAQPADRVPRTERQARRGRTPGRAPPGSRGKLGTGAVAVAVAPSASNRNAQPLVAWTILSAVAAVDAGTSVAGEEQSCSPVELATIVQLSERFDSNGDSTPPVLLDVISKRRVQRLPVRTRRRMTQIDTKSRVVDVVRLSA